jgi:hypothetical protein
VGKYTREFITYFLCSKSPIQVSLKKDNKIIIKQRSTDQQCSILRSVCGTADRASTTVDPGGR